MTNVYRPADPDPRHSLDFSKERILFPANDRHFEQLYADLAETDVRADFFIGNKTPHWILNYASVATLVVLDLATSSDLLAAGLIHACGRSGKVIVSLSDTNFDAGEYSYITDVCHYYGILPYTDYENLADAVLMHCNQPRKYRNVLDALK
jgi:hypothetical protein